MLVSIPGGDLLETVSRNIGELTNTLARGLETVHLNSLKVQDMFLISKEENKENYEIEDVANERSSRNNSIIAGPDIGDKTSEGFRLRIFRFHEHKL